MSKRPHQQKAEPATNVRLWTHSQATKAVPYFRSIAKSLRENWLVVRQTKLRADLVDAQPGGKDRLQRIAREEIGREENLAQKRLDDAWNELAALNVYSFDPLRGLALIPFARGEQLAWFIFDAFDPGGLVAWRLDTDPPEMLRPIVEGFESATSPNLPAAEVDLLLSDDTRPIDDEAANRGGAQK